MGDDGTHVDELAGDVIAGDTMISDEELTRLALAADLADIEVDPDAVPFSLGDAGAQLLPEWYMPSTLHGGDRHRKRRAVVVAGIVLSMLIVNGVGICVTYGIPEVGDRLVRFW